MLIRVMLLAIGLLHPCGAASAASRSALHSSRARPDLVRPYLALGHTQPITTAAWSPDGKRLAFSCDLEAKIRVCELATVKVQELSAEDRSWCLVWSADGRRLAAGCLDGSILPWNVHLIHSPGRPAAARGQAPGPFPDVPPHRWADEAVDELAARGIFTGYPDGAFRGQRTMTRYEVAVAVSRVMEDPLRRIPGPPAWPVKPIPGPPPTDVPEQHWAAHSVLELRQWGILAGYPDGTFRGDQSMSRDELSLVLQRVRAFAFRLWDLALEQQRKKGAPVGGEKGPVP